MYDVFARRLARLEPRALFGLMGEDTAALATELAAGGVPYYNTRHEAVAVAMADGYSWASGAIGICLVSRGPGLTNSLTAIRSAVRGRRRLLLIAGAPPTAGHSPDPKDVDERAIAAAVGLAYFRADEPHDAEAALANAVESAEAGEPALVAVAADVLNGPATAAPEPVAPPPRAQPPGAGRAPSPTDVQAIVDLLEHSQRPLILAGRGAANPATKEVLEALAERTGALIGTSLLGKDLFRGSPYDIGVVGGFASDPALPVLAEVDCVLAFGASLNTYTTARRSIFRDTPVVQVDVDPANLGAHHPVQIAVTADARLTAQALIDALPHVSEPQHPFHAPASLQRLEAPLFAGSDLGTGATIDPRLVAVVMDAILPDDRVVVLDSGAFMAYPGKYVRVAGPGSFRATTDFGSIGQGLGTALGVAVARPRSPVVLFIGDGGLMMTLGDLDTAVRYELPLIVVVMNDHAYGAEKALLGQLGVRDDYAIFPDSDLAATARGLGIESTTVRNVEELRALRDAFAGRSRPLLLDCKINPAVAADWLRA
jgi:thiamine pyrophosphate-dependent acetolactate synthase large subunit-like protein